MGVPAGTMLGRYRLGEVLGRGGMGSLFRATDTETGAAVAVKVLLADLAWDEEVRSRFVREAEAYRRLDHPHVVGYVGSGVEGEVYYLVLELVEGRDLESVLEAEGALGLERGLALLATLLETVDYLHAQDILHRDLKPANVMLQPDGAPKLLDFGLARADDALVMTADGTRIGTYRYAAPEQNEGRKVDARADLYALGVLALEAITGTHPFPGTRPIHVLVAQLNEDYPALTSQVPGAPPELDAFFQGLLRAKREQRYESAAAARAALRAITGR